MPGGASAAEALLALAGVWRIEKPVTVLRTADGTAPPLTAEAARVYEQRQQGDAYFDSATWCASVGMPRIMLVDSPFEIVLQPPYVAFLHQWNWWAHVVYLDGALAPAAAQVAGGGGAEHADGGAPVSAVAPHLGGIDPTGPMGTSIGRWEGGTLVVETTDLRDSTLLDNSGLPHSEALKLTERIRLVNRDVLEDRMRFEDPLTFSAAWETVVRYRRQHRDFGEDVCLDRIRNGHPAVNR